MRNPSVPVKAMMLTLSVVASLGLAEGVATVIRGGAFPYLNVFEHDPTFGVVMTPGARTRLRTRLGHTTSVRVNAQGFRGPDWNALPTAGRVLILGDSQVMGFGVEEEDTMAARLSHVTQGALHGLAAGTPSWGPIESVLAARDLVPRFAPDHVVFVANLANDWEEAPVANRRRTTARDGWSAHAATPVSPSLLPGSVLRHSHLVFALREVWAHVQRPNAVPADTVLRTLRNAPTFSAVTPDHSRLTQHLRSVLETCNARCRVTLMVLPMDVQVGPHEWAKYQTVPRPVGALDDLADALLEDARLLGVRSVDLRPVLAAHQPGAFLPDDPHLSSRGHLAAALTLARTLTAPQAMVTP